MDDGAPHLHPCFLTATLSALDGVTGLAAAIVPVCIGLAAIEVRERLVLVASAAQLDRHSRGCIDDLDHPQLCS